MLVSVYIEGNKYVVESSHNMLETCLSLGFNIPYFCWHPALGSVGACRQCVVKKYNTRDDPGCLVMSCMTPVSDGVSISIFDKESKDFRKNILELLMINHPHDCPVCEEGGNCHLQDMTVMTNHTYRRYRFTKRTHNNQYLGPFIAHEMNRCITCYRCVRYYQNYAGGDDLGVFGIHDNIYFGRVEDGALQSEFSGNLIEVCPTGVFTDKTKSQNYTRKWDAVFSPSICHQCSVGCNIILGERYGKLCRVENRYHGSINGYFLCDRGRFGCDYVNVDVDRSRTPLQKNSDGSWVTLNQVQAVQSAVCSLKSNSKIIGIGSTRASIESNFALRELVGKNNFYVGISCVEQEKLLLISEILFNSGIYIPSLREVETYDCILILGEDITQTGARIALSVRQAVNTAARTAAKSQGIFEWNAAAVINFSQDIKYPLFITSIDKTKLDDIAMFTYYDSVQNQARFAFAIAHALDNTAPKVSDFDDKYVDKLNIVVHQLINSRKPLIISGSNTGSKELIAASANIAQALKNRGSDVGITFVVSDVNSMGLAMMDEKKNLDDFFVDINNINNDTSIGVIILENNLYRHISADYIDVILKKINYLMVLDHQHNMIQEKANLVLSVTNFAESDGTVVNYESRAQRFFKLYNPQFYYKNTVILESWRWLYLIRDVYCNYFRKKSLHIDYVIDAIVRACPKLMKIKEVTPDSSFRIHGQKIAKSPHRYSGRTAIHTNINVHEPRVPQDNDTMFTFSMEGNYSFQSSHSHISFAWSPGWNSPQSWNKLQDKVGKDLCCGNPGVRLLDIKMNGKLSWYNFIPQSFSRDRKDHKWVIAPYWHLFGSEETSQKSKFIKDSMLNPYVMINPIDAIQFNIQKNMSVQFNCVGQDICLPVRFSIHLPVGHIGIPVGFPDIPIFLSGMYIKDIQGVLR